MLLMASEMSRTVNFSAFVVKHAPTILKWKFGHCAVVNMSGLKAYSIPLV